MSAAGVRSLALLAAVLCPAWSAAPTMYRYPLGLFAFPVPPGWKVEMGVMNNAMAWAGNAYTIVNFSGSGVEKPDLVAKLKTVYWSEQKFRAHRLMRTGAARLGDAAASFEIYAATTDKNVDTLVRMVTAPAGTAAMVLISACPTAEWDRWKAAFGSIEHGLQFVIAGENSAFKPLPKDIGPAGRSGGGAPAPAPPPAGRGGAGMAYSHGVPNGFRIAGRSGQAGQALTATFSGGRSAKATFQSAFRLAGAYFDRAPVLGQAVADPRDQLVEGFFRGAWQGAPVRGVMVASIGGGAGYVGMIFDREDQFSRSLPVLSRQMSASLPRAQGNRGQAAATPHPHPAQRLTQTQLLDGSGSIGLPAGWQITGSYKGCVDASGPGSAIASLGGAMIAFTNPLPGTPPNMIRGPYRRPIDALPLIWDYAMVKGALRAGQATLKIIETAPVAIQQGQGAYIDFRVYNPQGQDYRYLAFVQTSPIDETEWMAYLSVVGSSTDRFAELFPTLWAMWKSWSINSSVFRERMDATLQSMHETYAIIQGIDREKQRATEVGNLGWDQVIRGVTTIQNLNDGELSTMDNHDVDILHQLGLEGTGYRVVEPSELVGNGG